ncbi:MAG: class I SAM-dependent methyltransferase family protein [Methanosarcinaceae archaeon]|nr:class I SAM-dependent methyltransferase family protein [Methanosarcinaceae archaeon]
MEKNVSEKNEKVLSIGAFVLKKNGESARRTLDLLQIISEDLKPFAKDEFLAIPIKRKLSKSEIEKIGKEVFVKTGNAYFERRKKNPTISELLGYNPTVEYIGDIAIIEDEQNKKEIGKAIFKCNKNIKTVLLANSPVLGEFRTRKFIHVCGEKKTETVYKEYGCKYYIDLEKAYFTQRLSTERARILKKINEDDFVIDMFAGVGPFSILISKKKKPKTVIANDKNPEAVELLIKNIKENKVENIKALNLDAKNLTDHYKEKADHVIMNLPCSAHLFLNEAVQLTKKGGIIYYYAMAEETEKEDLYSKDIDLIKKAARENGKNENIIEMRKIRSYAPHQYNICIEARIE